MLCKGSTNVINYTSVIIFLKDGFIFMVKTGLL